MGFGSVVIRSLLVVVSVTGFVVHSAAAATITVDESSPGVGAVVVNTTDGLCSLREAIVNANADDQSGSSECAAGSGADTIVLPSNAIFTLTDAAVLDPFSGNSGLPVVTSDITIRGNGATIERDSLACDVSDFSQAASEFRLIYLDFGSLTIENATLRNGCIDQSSPNGGGAILANANLTLRGVTVIGNVAGNAGGGIDVIAGNALVTESLFASNTSLGSGGGISSGNFTTLRNTTFSSNSAFRGGGVYVLNQFRTHTFENLTFVDNTATSGGGIYNSNTSINGKNLVLQNSPCAESSVIITPVWNAEGASFDSGSTCATLFGSNFTANATLALGALADNGGPTETHALGAGSDALDAATDCTTFGGGSPIATDQRGVSRPQGTECDAGAYELLATLSAPATINVDETSPGSGAGVVDWDPSDGLCSLREAIDNANATTTTSTHPDCEAGYTSGADTIVLPTGATFTLTDRAVNDATWGASGLPHVTSTITIQGNDATITSSTTCNINGTRATDEFRIFLINDGVDDDLTLEDVTVTNGCADGSGFAREGGGLQNLGTLTVRRSMVGANRAHFGGGIVNRGTLLMVENSTIAGNSATLNGAGIYTQQNTIVRNSTLSNNASGNASGGIITQGQLTLEHVTFSGNTAATGRGIINNIGTVRAKNVILDGDDCVEISSGTWNAEGANFDSGTTCSTLFGSNFTANAALALGALADNGGPTLTHALQSNSDAIDAVGAADCTQFGSATTITTDQRGETRSLDGDGDSTALCDAGAFEVAPLTVDDVTQVEGDAGSSTFTFTLSRGTATVGNSTAQVDTADVSATAGSDYTAIAGQTATIADGATSTTVGVTVAGDTVYELAETFNVNLSSATNGVLVDASGLGTITNDDTAPVFSIGDVTLTEGDTGTTAFTFTIAKTGATEVTATVDAASSDTTATVADGDYTALPLTTVSFAPAEVDRTVTVNVNGDLVAELDETFNVDLANPTQATIFDGSALGTITNDDTAGVTVSKTTATTAETGTTDSFTYVLDAEPSADVTLTVTSGDTTEGLLTDADETAQGSVTLTFTAGNWNTPQTVTVTGQDDTLTDGNQTYNVTTTTASGDSLWQGLTVVAVAVTNNDDDTPGVDVTPTSGLVTTEAGGTASFDVVLNAQPASDVSIDFSTSDTTEGLVSDDGVTEQSTVTLTFTAGNWNIPQTVTVHGQDDLVTDGDQGYSVTSAAVSSTDTTWNGIAVGDVAVTNSDDEVSAISVTPTTGLITNEGGAADSFTVVLTSQPTADVTIGLSSSDTTEGTVSPSSLTFTSANWNTPQAVTVTGVDDDVDDGDQAYTVVTADAVSTDATYGGAAAADPSVLNVDDDTRGVTVTPNSGLVTTEAGGSDTFTIVLDSEPLADVTIGLSSDDTAEGVVSPTSLTFTSADWDTPQMVTVTGVDDILADGDQPYTIVTADAVSTDPGYNGALVSDVTVTNTDDETSANDGDGDGVDDTIEDGGPNGGDGNDDGIPDSTQPNVATFPAANGNGYITVVSTCELRDVQGVLKETLEPTLVVFPYALVEFRLPCATADMTLLFHAGDGWDPEDGYWKYGPETPGQMLTTKWYQLPGVSFDTMTVAGATVARASFTLNDGQLGDDTGVDGVIVDQGGPGAPGPVNSVPTASEWMLMLLAMTLATVGFWKLR